MGQLVAVTERRASKPGMVRFEANRSLTGMGHEHFHSVDEAIGPRPAAVLARRFLETGQVDGVHIYGSVITVDLRKGASAVGLAALVRDMYQYWKPGMEMPTFDAPEEAASPSGGGEPAAAGGGGGGAASEYEQRIPQTLRDRSAAALAKWRAAN
jgi:hypothetical protein